MARINTVLDDAVSYGFEGGPRYRTNVGEYPNRMEDRDSSWKYPKHEYSASFQDVNEVQRDYILAAIHVCRGRKHSLKFKDWNDYRIQNQEIQVLPGSSDPVQLYKTYAPFGPPYVQIRPIQAFNFAQLVDPLGNPVDGTLDTETGIFSPTLEWVAGAYQIALAEFYVWVRFDDDYTGITINNWRQHTARMSLKEDPFDFLPANVPNSWDD